MPDYRRNPMPSSTYFYHKFTGTPLPLACGYIDRLREAVRLVRKNKPFYIDCWMVG